VLTLLPSSWLNCDRIIDYCITTDPSSLNKKSPASTIPGSATVIKGGGTAEGFVFDPEIASLVHQLWQGLVIPEIMEQNFT
jgi:guanine nucleotide-binding protein subunit alpha